MRGSANLSPLVARRRLIHNFRREGTDFNALSEDIQTALVRAYQHYRKHGDTNINAFHAAKDEVKFQLMLANR